MVQITTNALSERAGFRQDSCPSSISGSAVLARFPPTATSSPASRCLLHAETGGRAPRPSSTTTSCHAIQTIGQLIEPPTSCEVRCRDPGRGFGRPVTAAAQTHPSGRSVDKGVIFSPRDHRITRPCASRDQTLTACQSASNFDPRSALKSAPLMETCSDGSARPGGAGRGCAAGASADR